MSDRKDDVAALAESLDRLDDATARATVEVTTAIGRLGPGDDETRSALEDGMAALAEANDGVADALSGDSDGLDRAKAGLAKLTAANDRLPETRRALDALGKTSTADMDETERGQLWDSLVDRFRPAVTEGYLRDLRLNSVDELDEDQRQELERRIEETTAKWRR